MKDYEKLLEIAIKFLTLGKNTSNDNSSNEEIDMDFVKDMDIKMYALNICIRY